MKPDDVCSVRYQTLLELCTRAGAVGPDLVAVVREFQVAHRGWRAGGPDGGIRRFERARDAVLAFNLDGAGLPVVVKRGARLRA